MKRSFERDYVDHGSPNSADYMMNDSPEKRRKMARIEYENPHQSNYTSRPPANRSHNTNYYDDGYSRNRFYPHNYMSQQPPSSSSSSSSSSSNRRGDYYPSNNRFANTNGASGREQHEVDNGKRRLPSPPPPLPEPNQNQQSSLTFNSRTLTPGEHSTSDTVSTFVNSEQNGGKPLTSQLGGTMTTSPTRTTTIPSRSEKVQDEISGNDSDNAMATDIPENGENESTPETFKTQKSNQPEKDQTSSLSREQVLKEIHSVDESISDINAKLVVAKAKPNSEKDESDLDKTIKNKNKIQQIYFENRKKCQDADSIFHFLLPDSMVQDESYNPLQHLNISELPQVKETISTFALIADELEKNIISRWQATHSHNLQLADQYRSLKRRWSMKQEKRRRKKKIASEDSDDEDEDVEQYKNLTAVCPPMLSEEERRLEMRTRNGYVEPTTVHREQKEQRLYETAWTDEERKIFMQKFAQYPKNCKKIATFLPNKTTYDCVNYYYNHKLTPEFVKLREKLKNKKKYMKRVYDEGPGTRNRTSIMEPESPGVDEIETRSRRSAAANAKPRRTNNSAATVDEEWNDMESAKFISLLEEHGRNFTAISQGMKGKSAAQCQKFFNSNKKKLNLESYLPTSRARSTGNRQPASAASRPQTRRAAANQVTDLPVTPVEETTPALAKKTKKQVSIWTNSEKDAFLDLLLEFGKNWKHISEHIPSKTENQIKNFFQNYKVKLGIATPPGMKRAKKKKRPSIIVEPPAELCKLAEIAQQVQEKGDASVHELHSLLCDESSIPLNMRSGAFTNSTPPPPPSLSTVNPNTDMKRYAISGVPMVNNVELLAIAALQDGNNAKVSQENQAPSQIVNYPPKPLSEPVPTPTPAPKKTTKAANPRRSRSASNAGATGTGSRTPRKTDSGGVRSQPQQQSPPQLQHHQPQYLHNYNSMYGVHPHNLLNLPSLQPMTGSTHMEDQITSEASTIKRSPAKKQQAQHPQTQQQQQSQHTHAQQPWFSPFPNLLSQRPDIPPHDVNAFGPVPPPPPSIDLTSSESLSASYGAQRPQSNIRQHPTGSNTAPPAMTNLPPFHAFSTVLSQLPAMPETTHKPGSNGQEKKSEGRNVMDQLAQPFTTFPSATPVKQDRTTSNVVNNSSQSSGTMTQQRVDNRVSFQDLDGGRVPDFMGGFKPNQTQATDWKSTGTTDHHHQTTTTTTAATTSHNPPQSNVLSFPSNSIFSTLGNPSVSNSSNNASTGNAFSSPAFPLPNTQPTTGGSNPYPDHQTLFAMLQQTPPQVTAYRGAPTQGSPAFSHSATPPLLPNSSLYPHATPSPPPLPFLPGLSPRVSDLANARPPNK